MQTLYDSSIDFNLLSKFLKSDLLKITIPDFSINTGYITSKGTIDNQSAPSKDYVYTTPIKLTINQTISFSAKGYSNNVGMISVCDKNGDNIVVKVISQSNNTEEYFYTATEDCYILLSFYNNSYSNGKIYFSLNLFENINNEIKNLNDENQVFLGKPSNPLKAIDKNIGYISIFNKIGCIGDSITEGAFNHTFPTTGDTPFKDFGYPAQLKKILNCDVKNFGKSGTTTKSWITHMADKVFTAENKCEAYIIAIGTNDIGYSGKGDGNFTGETTTDIDINDYNNNADTSVGNYAKIIQKIIELQPQAKIFCVGLPYTRNWEQAIKYTNIKIKEICNLLNCYYLDLEKYWVQAEDVSEYKSKFYLGGHPNVLGYQQFVNALISYINYIIYNNLEDFKQVPFIGTDFNYA